VLYVFTESLVSFAPGRWNRGGRVGKARQGVPGYFGRVGGAEEKRTFKVRAGSMLHLDSRYFLTSKTVYKVVRRDIVARTNSGRDEAIEGTGCR
jgi:hypothetical protein